MRARVLHAALLSLGTACLPALAAAPDGLVVTHGARDGVEWTTERRAFDGQLLTGRIVLTRAPDAGARDRINVWLAKHIGWPDPPASCEKDHPESCDDGWDGNVLFANSHWFAVGGNDYWHGGAHPSNDYWAVTFDLRDGRVVDWRELLRINDPPAAPGRSGCTPLDLTRRDLLAALVVRASQKEGVDECLSMLDEALQCEGERCACGPDVRSSVWSMFPTPEGLAVAPDFYSEATRGCRGSLVTIPWKDVRRTMLRPIQMP